MQGGNVCEELAHATRLREIFVVDLRGRCRHVQVEMPTVTAVDCGGLLNFLQENMFVRADGLAFWLALQNAIVQLRSTRLAT